MTPRVTEYWHPDNGTLFVHRAKDVAVVATALHAAFEYGQPDVVDLCARRELLTAPGSQLEVPFGIGTDEAPIVVSAIARYADQLNRQGKQPLTRRRAASLAGEMICASPNAFFTPQSRWPGSAQ